MMNWKCRISVVCLIWVFALTGCQGSFIAEQNTSCSLPEFCTEGEESSFGEGDFRAASDEEEDVPWMVWGRDVCASWQMDADGSIVLTFQLFDEEEATEINLGFPEKLGNMDDFRNAYQAAMDYDMEQGKLTFVMMQCTGTQMYVAEFFPDKTDSLPVWRMLELPEEAGVSAIYAADSVIAGEWYYNAGCDVPVRVNLQDGSFQILTKVDETCRNLIPQGSYDPDGTEKMIPCGLFEGKVIWRGPIYTDTTVLYGYFVFDEERFLGAFYQDENTRLHLYDSKGKLLSVR